MNNREIILKCLKTNGPLTSKELADVSGIHYDTVTANLRALREENKIRPDGKVRRDGENRAQQTYVPTRMRKPFAEDEAEPRFNFAPDPTVAALQARLAELEAFKAQAVARHPDLIPFDYEAYRSAIIEFFHALGKRERVDHLVCREEMTFADRAIIDAMIAAAALFPKDTP
jgi:hypothetical protein